MDEGAMYILDKLLLRNYVVLYLRLNIVLLSSI